jgi:hypothetical protein
MDHLTTCIEQLDLAAQQLRHDNAAYRRFALILTDNIVELMCYDRCEYEFRFEDLLHGHGKYQQGKKAKVLGGDFKDRLNFLQSIKVLDNDQQSFVGHAHEYRNESYHTGIVHDDIMHALAWHYQRVACGLFVALRRSYVYRHIENKSPAWAKHYGSDKLYWGEEDAYKRVSFSLGTARPLPEPNLPDALATSIRSRLDTIQEAIDSLVSDSPKKLNATEVIRDIQYWDAYGKHFTGQKIDPNDSGTVETAEQFIQDMKNKWKPEHRRSPIPRWIDRAERLRHARNPANALQNFASLCREIEPFGEMAFSSANALGAYIDEQSDRVREDRAFESG